MILEGQVVYRDFTNSEKKVFLKNLVIPWSAVLRETDLDIGRFQERWLNKSLHELRRQVTGKELTLVRLRTLFEEWNVFVVKEIGMFFNLFFSLSA